MIVEDDRRMRAFEKELLVAAGYVVMETDNAEDGVDIAIKEKPDVILMDIRLPNKKRGIGAAKILRKTPETKDIPIIFVTGYLLGEDSSEVKNISNHSYINKPFEVGTFLSEIKKYVE